MTQARLAHVRLLAEGFSASYRFYRDGLGRPTPWEENGAYAELETDGEVRLAILPCSELEGDVELRVHDSGWAPA